MSITSKVVGRNSPIKHLFHPEDELPSSLPPKLITSLERALKNGIDGRYAASCQRWGPALLAFSKAAIGDRANAHIYMEMSAQILLEENHLLKAIKLCTESIKSEPAYPYAHWTLARALREFGELYAARSSYETALTLSNGTATILSEYHGCDANVSEIEFDQMKTELEDLNKWMQQMKNSEVSVSANGRWIGDIRFYELCDPNVNHGDNSHRYWRKGKLECCSKTVIEELD